MAGWVPGPGPGLAVPAGVRSPICPPVLAGGSAVRPGCCPDLEVATGRERGAVGVATGRERGASGTYLCREHGGCDSDLAGVSRERA